MSIAAEYWAWDAGGGNPFHRLALVVLAKFADASNKVNIPTEAFTYYCAFDYGDVEPLLLYLEAEELIKIEEISPKNIKLSLLVRFYNEDGE